MKKIGKWLNGRKTQIGAIASLTVGFLLNKQVIDETTGTYALALLGVWVTAATVHREKKRIANNQESAE